MMHRDSKMHKTCHRDYMVKESDPSKVTDYSMTDYSMREGFTLVEVVVAVVVLAILVVPILVYFTNAATSASSGKNSQKANMAGQTAMEEINSCVDFDQVEALGNGGTWSFSSGATPAPADAQVELERDINVDGNDYTVKAVVDYDEYDKSAGRYNSYTEKDLKPVYSEKSAVLTEFDQKDEAENYFLIEKKSAIDSSKISREIRIEVTDASSTDSYKVHGYYHYTYLESAGATPIVYDAEVGTTEVYKSNLENIYLMFNKFSSTEDGLAVKLDSSITSLNLYLVCQSTVDSTYKMKINPSESENQDKVKFYTNKVNSTDGFDVDGATSKQGGFVSNKASAGSTERRNNRRIAKVTVDVYLKSNLTDSIVHLESSKAR